MQHHWNLKPYKDTCFSATKLVTWLVTVDQCEDNIKMDLSVADCDDVS
jgi:hypothetical protein